MEKYRHLDQHFNAKPRAGIKAYLFGIHLGCQNAIAYGHYKRPILIEISSNLPGLLTPEKLLFYPRLPVIITE